MKRNHLRRLASTLLVPLAAACVRAPGVATAPAPARDTLPPSSIWDERGGRLPVGMQLLVPVAGVLAENIPDTYFAEREGKRVHQAVDIVAPRGTPVLAAVAGHVLKMHRNSLGGITLYLLDDASEFIFYYAHLDRYRSGIAEGQHVARGDTVAFVGTTGNASPDTPHLHFQMLRAAADLKWFGGTPVDPRPLFARQQSSAR